MKNLFCYNCVIPLDKFSKHKEHIPQENLYNGFPVQYKFNNITVPERYTCNNGKLHIDDELRNFLAIFDNGKINSEGLRKTLRSLLRKDKSSLEKDGNNSGVTFHKGIIYNLFGRNAKGLYYDNFQEVFPDYLSIRTIAESDENSEIGNFFKYIHEHATKKIREWKKSGHEDVFRYHIAKVVEVNEESFLDNASKNPIIVICNIHIWKTIIGSTILIHKDLYQAKD